MVEHRIPENLNEALKLLYRGDYQVMAGGTDLMVQRRSLSDTPVDFSKNIVYCAHLPELRGVRKEPHRVEIGAMTPLEDLLHHPDVPSLLRRAIAEMASPAIRHVATLGGNIVNASPAGDTLPVLYLLDAWAELRSLAGSRMILIRDLITGPRTLKIHSGGNDDQNRDPRFPFYPRNLCQSRWASRRCHIQSQPCGGSGFHRRRGF